MSGPYIENCNCDVACRCGTTNLVLPDRNGHSARFSREV
jgi:hypothetical protein